MKNETAFDDFLSRLNSKRIAMGLDRIQDIKGLLTPTYFQETIELLASIAVSEKTKAYDLGVKDGLNSNQIGTFVLGAMTGIAGCAAACYVLHIM